MRKILIFYVCLMTAWAAPGLADTVRPQMASFMDATSYDMMYPYMNNKMRVALNPGTTPTQSIGSIDALVKTGEIAPAGRRVVARGTTNTARAATGAATTSTVARSGITTSASAMQGLSDAVPRRVVARNGQNANTRGTTQSGRAVATPAITSATGSVTSGKCLADYTECMNGYCRRENTAYNRCYCSARLAQIDAEYQPAIDNLVKQILTLKNGGGIYTADEMTDYWNEKVGQYTGDDSWADLDNALNINWADTESRVRGQNAFLTGHEYCVQHLRGCQYMASNLRDAYRSDIARDCLIYENALQKIKNVAESVVENYSE